MVRNGWARGAISVRLAALALPAALLALAALARPALTARADRPVFRIGEADGRTTGFGCADADYTVFLSRFPGPVLFRVGQSRTADWPFIQPSTMDSWAGGARAHTFTVEFDLQAADAAREQYLCLGLLCIFRGSRMDVGVNGKPVASRRLEGQSVDAALAFDPRGAGTTIPVVFPIPAGALRPGRNAITLTLDDGSWIVYDYVQLSPNPAPPAPAPVHILADALAGPLHSDAEIVFAVRQPGQDGHWYANFGYDANDPAIRMYADGGRLCRLNLRTGRLITLLEDPKGGIRDPQVNYAGDRILFSYRRGGAEHYNLCEIGIDGRGLRQITTGPFDDIEPTYLPDGDIVFVSSRCKRWVNCWRTPVAVLFRCGPAGQGIRQISANVEHDNTPWPLPDGRILYTRWEYIDRSQVDYHHLWTANPDGTNQSVYYGNLRPGVVMIDAKPIGASGKVAAIFSPGHGQCEHDGDLVIVDPAGGPDDRYRTRRISTGSRFRDPWPLSEECFLMAAGPELLLMNGNGQTERVFRLPDADIRAGLQVHEPRPLAPRRREYAAVSRLRPTVATGRFVLQDVARGRNMAGVKPGDIRSLLVLESLPKPVNFTGGMEPLSYGGTFTLERILGTVPVEADGSACFDAPAMRSLVFVALDAAGVPVKRMQSFATVAPGETVGCIGCHEQRTAAPAAGRTPRLAALARPPSAITPIAGVPDLFDFPRDIQPILDRRCLSCHSWRQPSGGVALSGDHGPLYSHSYFTLFARSQVSDGRNRAISNYAPRTLGSVASPLMRKLDGSHHGARCTPEEARAVALWIDSGAAYPGTYTALKTGMIGGYQVNALDRSDLQWPATRAAMEAARRRCAGCHTGARALPESVSDDHGLPPWVDMAPDDWRRRYSNHMIYNLSEPARSRLLLAPLARSAGGWESCGQAVLSGPDDPDYRAILGGVQAAADRLAQIKRFDTAGFIPHPGWFREMRRYGILPPDTPDAPLDFRAVERRYWESLWYRAPAPVRSSSAARR